MDKNKQAIVVEGVSKVYKLYDQPSDRLKEALHPLRKPYHKDFHALKDLSLSIPEGETIGFVGKNGAGKSTLLKIITGVLSPTCGSLQVNGKVSALLELGAGFNPELTGIENVYFSGTLLGYERAEMTRRMDGILAYADIGDYVHQPVKTYSSGMFARLAFAVAINVDPDILIVDEVLAVGDMNFQAKCFAKFKEFQEAGKTIIIVSHSLDTIIRYCQRAVFLDAGEKIMDGNPKEVIDAYKKHIVGVSLTEESSSEPDLSESVDMGTYKNHFQINKDLVAYGDERADIIDYGIFDHDGNPSQKFFSGDRCSVKMKVRFNVDLEQPIFAFTIKDLKGLEITGTNTYFEHVDTGIRENGSVVEIEFAQVMSLQSGSYSLSLGCTNFEEDSFVVHSRLYDVIFFEVISDKQMVGFFDPSSEITIKASSSGEQ